VLKEKSSIILLYCCLDGWTVLRSSIIVLATVEPLHNAFALSSDARYLHVCVCIYIAR